MSIAKRLLTYINILAFQGLILFGIAFIQLIDINIFNLIFILLETIIFKSIAIPWFLKYIIKKNKLTREAEPYIPNFFSLIIVTAIIVLTILLSNYEAFKLINKTYFIVALSTLFSGLYIIVSRRKIITHILGYLVIENGVFILSLAVGNEMPMLVNLGILLDFFVCVLVLGIFVNKIGDVFKEPEVEKLNQLRD